MNTFRVVLWASLAAAAGGAAEYTVAPGGDNAGAGTKAFRCPILSLRPLH